MPTRAYRLPSYPRPLDPTENWNDALLTVVQVQNTVGLVARARIRYTHVVDVDGGRKIVDAVLTFGICNAHQSDVAQ